MRGDLRDQRGFVASAAHSVRWSSSAAAMQECGRRRGNRRDVRAKAEQGRR